MVHSEMIGITELMTDDQFMGWMEAQDDERIENLSSFEVYSLYRREKETGLN